MEQVTISDAEYQVLQTCLTRCLVEKGVVAERDPDLDALMAAQRLIADLSERLYGGGDDDGLDLMVDDPNVRVFRSDAPFSRL